MLPTPQLITRIRGVEDSEEYAWAFAQSSSNPPVTAIKTSKSNNVKAKQTTTLNKVQGRLNPFWTLLDNQSTVNVFYNALFLHNVRKVDRELHLYTNAGMSTIDEVGDLPGFRTVWLHRD